MTEKIRAAKSSGKAAKPAVRTPSLQDIVKQTGVQRLADASQKARLSKAVLSGVTEELKKL